MLITIREAADHPEGCIIKMLADDLKIALEHLTMFVDSVEGIPDKHCRDATDFLDTCRLVYSNDLLSTQVDTTRLREKHEMDVKVFGPESFITLPAAPNTCPECGLAHRQNEPHDAKSLLYQVRFQQEHGRFPTWEDAWAHCEPEVQQEWAALIAEHQAEG